MRADEVSIVFTYVMIGSLNESLAMMIGAKNFAFTFSRKAHLHLDLHCQVKSMRAIKIFL